MKYHLTLIYSFLFVLALVSVSLMFTAGTFAQTSGSSSIKQNVSGTISDKSGNPLPNALLTLYGAGGQTTTQRSNSAGGFSFALSSGKYSLYGSSNGYQSNVCSITVDKNPIKVTFVLAVLGTGGSSCIATVDTSSASSTSGGADIGNSTTSNATTQSSQNENGQSIGDDSGVTSGTTDVGPVIKTTSKCAITAVGEPKDESDIPAICSSSKDGGAPGNYKFPLNLSVVTGIATEMAAYPGGYSYEGHREHAGLDIGAPIGGHTPVYSVADGTVLSVRDSCYVIKLGYLCRIDIGNDNDNYISSYTHVDALASTQVGTKVKKGQQIAAVHYWTQYENMDHLHFEMLDKTRLDNLGVGFNINPRNHFPELQRFPPSGYGNTGADVRVYTNSTGYFWVDDGREFAETYRNHPPCGGDCWAH